MTICDQSIHHIGYIGVLDHPSLFLGDLLQIIFFQKYPEHLRNVFFMLSVIGQGFRCGECIKPVIISKIVNDLVFHIFIKDSNTKINVFSYPHLGKVNVVLPDKCCPEHFGTGQRITDKRPGTVFNIM